MPEPLTEEEYNAALAKGFTPQEIIGFEKIRLGQGGGMTAPGMGGELKLVGVTIDKKGGMTSKLAPPKSSTKFADKATEIDLQAKAVENLLRSTVAAWKTMRETTGESGRIAGVKNWVAGKLGELSPSIGVKENPNVVAFQGQINETASALAKIANPSGRPGPELIRMFKETLMNLGSTDKEMQAQMRDSIHSAYSRAFASRGQTYDKVTRAKIDSIVDNVVNTPSYSGQDSDPLGLFKK